MKRTQTKQIHVGPVAIGGGAPVAVQSMCNTHTSDARATICLLYTSDAADEL